MSGVVDMVTGKASKKAERAQRLQREQASIANARQINAANADAARAGLVRRNARGRRLLASAEASDLPSVVA